MKKTFSGPHWPNVCTCFARGLFGAAFLLLLTCSGTSTSDLLEGTFLDFDKTAPDIVVPDNNDHVTGSDVTLVWTSRKISKHYIVEVSEDESFTKHISGSPFKVKENNLALTGLVSKSYYWRVRTDIANNDSFSEVSAFHILLDAIYVYCPAGEECSDEGMYGTQSKPYRTIKKGLDTALANSIGVIVAKRNGANLSYNETLVIPDGMTITGGYDYPAWKKASESEKTSIEGSASKMVQIAGITKDTVVDGLDVTNTSTDNNTYALAVYVSDNHLTVKNSSFTAIHRESVLINNSYINFLNNTVHGGNTDCSAALKISGGGPVVKGNRIYGGIRTVNKTMTVHIENNSDVTLDGNVMYGPILREASSTSNYARTLIVNGIDETVIPVIKNNIILPGSFQYDSNPNPGNVYIEDDIKVIFSNNMVVGGETSIAGVSLGFGLTTKTQVVNNIFVNWGLFANNMMIYRSATNATALENNAFWHSVSGISYILYWDDAQRKTISDLETNVVGVDGPDKFRGNILLTDGSTGSPFVRFPLFSDITYENNTSSASVLKISNDACTHFSAGHYIEWNYDGIARKVTACNDATDPDELTIDPPLDDAAKNLSAIRILYWGTSTELDNCYANNTVPCPALKMDFHLKDTAPDNLKYGGKDTSRNNCGAPAGGPGLGIGSETCGAVTTDFDGNIRTNVIPGTATVDNTSLNNPCATHCGSPRSTNEQAVPGGFSMGPYEKD